MKLAFSTLGCPNWSFDEIFATAKDMSIDGIEIRGVGNEMYAPKNAIFSEANYKEIKARLRNSGMEISAFATGAALGMPNSEEVAVPEVLDYIDLASKMEVPFVRVMISPSPQPEDVDLAEAKRLYNMLCEKAAEKNVCILVETNGALANSEEMAKFMEGTHPTAAGVLWDLHHPYRFWHETPEQTYSKIGKYVKYLHLKDSVEKNGTVQYRMMGHGDVPVFDAINVLHKNGYDGFVTLEWVKRWNVELQEPGVVFYHYTTYMEYLLEQIEQQ